METKLIIYFFLINAVAFIFMGVDKRRAVKKKKRISELSFSLMTALGGVVGIVLGMFLYKHKTLKVSFHLKIFLMFLFSVLLLLYIFN